MIYSHLPTKSYDWKHRKEKPCQLAPSEASSWSFWPLRTDAPEIIFDICVFVFVSLIDISFAWSTPWEPASSCWCQCSPSSAGRSLSLLSLSSLSSWSSSSSWFQGHDRQSPLRQGQPTARLLQFLKHCWNLFFRYVSHLKSTSFKLKVHLSSHGPPPSSDTPGPPVGRQEPRFESVRPSFGPTPPSPATRGWMTYSRGNYDLDFGQTL